ncbi:MAG: hypothetical protein EOO74_02205 [Myxococcales bacterium]|nr:MAG: hypothetical protein EOO74_02205 [Myxococcales bacterium]
MARVTFSGWQKNIQTITLIKLLTRHGLTLGEAHRRVTTELLEGKTFVVDVADDRAAAFVRDATHLGANVSLG